MRFKATFVKDGATIAEAEFDAEGPQDFESFSALVFLEFRRLQPSVSLLDDGVWMKWDTVRQ
jgi:hypothetical protein